MKKSMLFFCLACMCGACHLRTDSSIDSKAVNQEIKDRKIKRFTESEIVEAAYACGQKIATEVFSGFDSTKNLCDLGSLPDVLAKYPLLIKRISISCKDDTILDLREKQVWDAYKHDFQSQIELRDNIQKLDSGMFLYTLPKIVYTQEGGKSVAMISFVLEQKEVIRGL